MSYLVLDFKYYDHGWLSAEDPHAPYINEEIGWVIGESELFVTVGEARVLRPDGSTIYDDRYVIMKSCIISKKRIQT